MNRHDDRTREALASVFLLLLQQADAAQARGDRDTAVSCINRLLAMIGETQPADDAGTHRGYRC